MHDPVSGNGSTVNMLPLDGLQQPELVISPAGLIDHFSDLAGSIRSRCERFVIENRDLARTRDVLLPKLLSGQLLIPDSLKGAHA